MWRAFPFEPCEVGVLRTSLNFVDSLWEILGPLMRGVPTVIAPDDVVADPAAFVDLAGAHGVTRLFLVPSYLDALLERVPDVAARAPALRTWFTGGEPLTAELCRRFRRLLPDARLYNIYGSSELWDVTVCDTGTDGIEHARVAVGHPIDNLRAYVLDLDGHPVSEGMTGTLHVAGAGLPRGYLDDTLTRQRFVHRRLDGDRPERLFDTGDLACYRTDGSIDVVGRRDQQLKLRGFRIEPDEIEAVLEQHPHVGEAAVALRPIGRGDERLVAYAVAAAQRGGDDHDDVAAYLATQLPPYMIPHRIVWLDAIPRTPSGKKDRRRLPVWPGGAGDDVAGSDGADGADRLSASRVGPDGDELGLETVLARAFTDVLGVGSVGRDDHFFADLGGHSLLAVRLCSRVATVLGIELPLSDVFDHPTVALLAARLRPALASAVDTKTLLDELEALDAEELEALLADLDETSSGAGDE
jgi:acyl carrier protein